MRMASALPDGQCHPAVASPLKAPNPVLSSSPLGVCRFLAPRPIAAARHPNSPRAPSTCAPALTSVLLLAPESVNPGRVNPAPPAASGSCAGITLSTPPSASDPYSTLAGPRISSTRRANAVSIDGPSSSLHE